MALGSRGATGSRPARDLAPPPGARVFHLVTAVMATAGLLLQAVLTATAPGEALFIGLLRLAGYFTFQANVLVAVTSWLLWVRPSRGLRRSFRVVRLDAVVAMTVTAAIYLVVLRGVTTLPGWSSLADALLHYAVPVMVVAGWFVYGPRRRVDRNVVLLSAVWPAGWFVWTLLMGAVSGFYPYPFVDAERSGVGSVLGRAVAVVVLLLLVAAAYLWADRRLDARARRPRWLS